ncbi:MAG: hypothetical protein GY822_32580 [Deltaproteobacteria bacterium]|nr:hypothetical protein [Deltaproteobacteria bacterium]
MSIMFSALVSSSRTSGDMLRRRKAFYACDGLSRAVVSLSQGYFSICGENCDTAGLSAFVGDVTNLLAAEYQVNTFELEKTGDTQDGKPLPSGPFKGMNAKLDNIKMIIQAEHSSMGYRCNTAQEISLGKVALFQFYVFSDTYFDGHPGPTMTLEGRAHINYDACPGGNIRASKITVAGNLRAGNNRNCRYVQWNGMAIKDGSGAYQSLNTGNDSDVAGWHNRALSTWDSNALDQVHAVPKLRPPFVGSPFTQNGANATDGKDEETLNATTVQKASETNNENLRFLVDPVRSADAEDVKKQKFAWLADIRIINGTWYKNDGSFPGIPIWSDHPGSFSLSNASLKSGLALQGSQKGQKTIVDAQGLDEAPMRYSMYAYENDGAGAFNKLRRASNGSTYGDGGLAAPSPVVSYGTVKRHAAPGDIYTSAPYWTSASWITEELCRLDANPHTSVNLTNYFAAASVAVPPVLATALGGTNLTFARSPTGDGQGLVISPNGQGIVSEPAFRDAANYERTNYRTPAEITRVTCEQASDNAVAGLGIGREDILLNATRGGFFDGHRGGHYTAMADTPYRAQVLPMNFDLEAFQMAMQETTNGELGAYFAGGTAFNGIVWISYPYPGSLTGLSAVGTADVRVANIQGDGSLYSKMKAGTIGTDLSYGSEPLIYGRRSPGQGAGPVLFGGVPLSIPDAIAGGVPTVPMAGNGAVAASQARAIFSSDFSPTLNSAQDVFATHVPAGSAAPAHFTQNHYATVQTELPFPLCSTDSTMVSVGSGTMRALGSKSAFSRFGESAFHVSHCGDYTAYNPTDTNDQMLGNTGGWITGVRVMNGRNLDSAVFPRGLSVISNMPMYVLGDMNNDSTPHSDETLPASASGEWIPLLLGGDVMYHLSNAWDDNRASWNNYSRSSTRVATNTIFNISELIGWVPSNSGNGGTRFHNLQGYLETWKRKYHYINGSVAIGWKAVYNRNNRTSGGQYAYSPPARKWTFDNNYRFFANQPPGTPTFDVAAMWKFSRD